MLRVALMTAVLGALPVAASAQPCFLFNCGGNPGQPSGPPAPPGPHTAPAPLLAAGIPAFVALGGGALVAKLRRKKTA